MGAKRPYGWLVAGIALISEIVVLERLRRIGLVTSMLPLVGRTGLRAEILNFNETGSQPFNGIGCDHERQKRTG
jgi:hypothetical protein